VRLGSRKKEYTQFARIISPDLIRYDEAVKAKEKAFNNANKTSNKKFKISKTKIKGFGPNSQKRAKIPVFRECVNSLVSYTQENKQVPRVPDRLFYLLSRVRPGPLPMGELIRRCDVCIDAWRKYFPRHLPSLRGDALASGQVKSIQQDGDACNIGDFLNFMDF